MLPNHLVRSISSGTGSSLVPREVKGHPPTPRWTTTRDHSSMRHFDSGVTRRGEHLNFFEAICSLLRDLHGARVTAGRWAGPSSGVPDSKPFVSGIGRNSDHQAPPLQLTFTSDMSNGTWVWCPSCFVHTSSPHWLSVFPCPPFVLHRSKPPPSFCIL